MSKSWIEDLVAYRRERFPAPLYLPFAAFIAAAGQVARGAPETSRAAGFGYGWLLASALIVQFRIWDDLADREHDRRVHPERTLPRSSAPWPFYGALLVAAVTSVALLLLRSRLRSSADVVGYGGLCVFYAIWYSGLRRVFAQGALQAHLLLIKYPIFVFLIGGGGWPPSGTRCLAAAAVYACTCVDELSTDPRLRSARAVLAIDMAGLVLVVILLASKAPSSIARAAQLAGASVLAFALVSAFRRAPTGRLGGLRVATFVLTSASLVNLAVRP